MLILCKFVIRVSRLKELAAKQTNEDTKEREFDLLCSRFGRIRGFIPSIPSIPVKFLVKAIGLSHNP